MLLFNLKKKLDSLIEWMKGKKMIMGAIPLLLWVLIYAIPVVMPEWTWAAGLGLWLQHWLTQMGIDLNDPLLTVGGGATLIGLLDKIRRLKNGEVEVTPPHED